MAAEEDVHTFIARLTGNGGDAQRQVEDLSEMIEEPRPGDIAGEYTDPWADDDDLVGNALKKIFDGLRVIVAEKGTSTTLKLHQISAKNHSFIAACVAHVGDNKIYNHISHLISFIKPDDEEYEDGAAERTRLLVNQIYSELKHHSSEMTVFDEDTTYWIKDSEEPIRTSLQYLLKHLERFAGWLARTNDSRSFAATSMSYEEPWVAWCIGTVVMSPSMVECRRSAVDLLTYAVVWENGEVPDEKVHNNVKSIIVKWVYGSGRLTDCVARLVGALVAHTNRYGFQKPGIMSASINNFRGTTALSVYEVVRALDYTFVYMLPEIRTTHPRILRLRNVITGSFYTDTRSAQDIDLPLTSVRMGYGSMGAVYMI